MPRSIPKVDFSSIQKAIQQAFDTYWGVRGQREQRGENEKDRQAAMQQLMMQQRGQAGLQKAGDIAAMERLKTGESMATERATELSRLEQAGQGSRQGMELLDREKQRGWQGLQNELDRQMRLALSNKELAAKAKLDVALDIPNITNSASEMIRGVMAAIKAGEETLFLSYPNFTPADWRTFSTLKDPNLLQSVKKKVVAYYKEITGEAARVSGVDIGKYLEKSLPVQTVPIDIDKATKGLDTGGQPPTGIMPPAQPGVPPRYGPPPMGFTPPTIDWSGKSDVELFNKIKNYIKQQFGK